MNEKRFTVKWVSKLTMVLSAVALFMFSQSMIVQAAAFKSAAEAILAAQNNKQYLFVLFYKQNDTPLKAMENTANEFKSGSTENIVIYKAKATDDKEKDAVGKYGIDRAPLPVLLVFAPNGVVSGGFSKKVSTEELKGSIVSNLVMDILKTVQQRKIALVVLQNGKTKFNKESSKAAQDFAGDAKLKGMVDIIKADPSDPKNSEFLSNSKLSKDMPESTVVFIIPPGSIAGVYPGNINKATLLAALSSCSSGGCGSGGCSDKRFKKNISPIETPLDKVSKLNGVTFTWDREKFPLRLFPEGRKIGLIAQEVEAVIPEVVNTDKEGYKSVEYDKLVALLIEGVKEMKQQLQKQETVIRQQGERIRELEAAAKKRGDGK